MRYITICVELVHSFKYNNYMYKIKITAEGKIICMYILIITVRKLPAY